VRKSTRSTEVLIWGY